MNPLRGKNIVSIGQILQAPSAGDAVIVIRGTEDIEEWMQDAKFLAVPCPFLGSGGNAEDGFTDMYESMTPGPGRAVPKIRDALANLAWTSPPTSLTICGHSLGRAFPPWILR